MVVRPGDGCSVIAPATQLRGADATLLDEAVALLESWGLHVTVRVERSHHFYLAGADEARAAHLAAALTDPHTRAIFCTRGGYGSPRLLARLDPGLSPGAKLLVGYSDVTALHLAAACPWPRVRPIHGPNLATRELLGPGPGRERNRLSLHRALFDPAYAVDEAVEFLVPGRAEGPLVGGCLSLVTSMLGTPFALRTRDAVLFLEDVGEAPYRIDRMLTQLRLAGAFDGVRGVVFGAMHDCKDAYNDLRDVIRDALGGLAVPVAFGLPSGHVPVNLALTRELFLADPNVRGFRTLVAVREVVGEADARPLGLSPPARDAAR